MPREYDDVTAERQAQLSEHVMASCGMKAVELASERVVQFVLDMGCNPNGVVTRENPGFSPLHCVCTLKHALSESIAKMLLEAGANANRWWWWWWCALPPSLPFPSLCLDLLRLELL